MGKAALLAQLKKGRRGKFNNVKAGGFDSKKEAEFAAQLELLRKATDHDVRVADVKRQVRYELIPQQLDKRTGKVAERACGYLADFVVTRASGKVDVIDVKGYKTAEYVIKRKLMLWVHGIKVIEV